MIVTFPSAKYRAARTVLDFGWIRSIRIQVAPVALSSLPDSMTATTRGLGLVRTTDPFLDARSTRNLLNSRTTEDA